MFHETSAAVQFKILYFRNLSSSHSVGVWHFAFQSNRTNGV